MDLLERAGAIDAEATALVATLPDLPAPRLAALVDELTAVATTAAAGPAALARTLAQVIGAYQDGRAVLEGWAIVASAAHALARAIGADDGHGAALAAVRFELETLLPPRDRAAAPVHADVPLTALTRRT